VPEGALLVVRVAGSGGRLVAEPLSLIDVSATTRPVQVLGLPPVESRAGSAAATTSVRSRVADLMRSRAAPRGPADVEAEPASADPPPPLPAALTDLRAHLEALAERGVGGASPGAVRADLAGFVAGARRIGLTALPVDVPDDPAAALLRTHFLVEQLTVALTGSGSGDPAPEADERSGTAPAD
jgi:hypothetical protein